MHPHNIENIVWLLLAGAAAVARMIKTASSASKRKSGGQPPRTDADQEERTRQVREQVARKIAQRRPRPMPAQPPGWGLPKTPRPKLEAPPDAPPEIPEPEEFVLSAPVPAAAVATTSIPVPPAAPILGGSAVSRRADLIDDLRSPQAARRAVLLREIIGPPVGLRRGGI